MMILPISVCRIPHLRDRSSVAASLKDDLAVINDWCCRWGMLVNSSKKKGMLISHSQTVEPLFPDLVRLEKVQAQATKLFPSIRHKGYQRRLADLRLFTLEQRRLQGLPIKTFKILRGFSGLDPASVFELSLNRT